ncbi:hypothetical protein M422DRAFT_267979 [Sphaerobolus stellatus SS14]|uniref:Uncharacterized protein n=1 Tax=Sphaerobolus stellatus (strain SS14) TaxID=990650 RepID=A0A0C9UYQ3_SPHS4|nr:hypothetical protein M422DRAFT_267979 [Sphaerobolus stellatus SS14]
MTHTATSLLPILSNSRFKVVQGGVQFAAPEYKEEGEGYRCDPIHQDNLTSLPR